MAFLSQECLLSVHVAGINQYHKKLWVSALKILAVKLILLGQVEARVLPSGHQRSQEFTETWKIDFGGPAFQEGGI